jgi:hypothetical protein
VRVNGIRIDLEKDQVVANLEALEKLKKVEVFLDFANFYRKFIRNYSRVVQPLTELKTALTTAPGQGH